MCGPHGRPVAGLRARALYPQEKCRLKSSRLGQKESSHSRRMTFRRAHKGIDANPTLPLEENPTHNRILFRVRLHPRAYLDFGTSKREASSLGFTTTLSTVILCACWTPCTAVTRM